MQSKEQQIETKIMSGVEDAVKAAREKKASLRNIVCQGITIGAIILGGVKLGEEAHSRLFSPVVEHSNAAELIGNIGAEMVEYGLPLAIGYTLIHVGIDTMQKMVYYNTVEREDVAQIVQDACNPQEDQ